MAFLVLVERMIKREKGKRGKEEREKITGERRTKEKRVLWESAYLWLYRADLLHSKHSDRI